MMSPKRQNAQLPKPSEGELRILRVLWERGPSTVREVFEHEQLETETGVGYTTFLKLMQIMHEKGLVERDETARSHVYSAVLTRDTAQKRLLADLKNAVFGGSTRQLVLQILSDSQVSKQEIAEIRAVLAQLDKETAT